MLEEDVYENWYNLVNDNINIDYFKYDIRSISNDDNIK